MKRLDIPESSLSTSTDEYASLWVNHEPNASPALYKGSADHLLEYPGLTPPLTEQIERGEVVCTVER